MLSWNEILLRLLLGALFGGAVGLERERKNWTAGLRTHMMVCVGATLTMIVSAFGFHDVLATPGITLDPSRVAAQVISGIGFIGAGTILFLRQEVIRGLTTASGLWTVAAIVLATGGGMYFAATLTTVIVIIILSLLKPIEKKYFRRYKQQLLKVAALNDPSIVQTVRAMLEKASISIANIAIDKKADETIVFVRLTGARQEKELAGIVEELQQLPSVIHVYWSTA